MQSICEDRSWCGSGTRDPADVPAARPLAVEPGDRPGKRLSLLLGRMRGAEQATR